MDETGPWDHAGSGTAAMRREAFAFTGNAREYFGIWIVNVLLTMLTLGIYSAWAKVRRQRYFHGNTMLAGASFDYHAKPIQILIGRIVVLVILVVYNLALNFVPLVGGLLFIAFLFAVPFFVMRGLRFSARVTSYRNVRFDFTGGYWGAFLAFVLGGMLAWGTVGLLAPFASRWMWRYTLGNLTYGGRPVDCDPRVDRLYGQWWMPALLLAGGVVVFSLGATGLGLAYGDMLDDILGGGGGSGTAIAGIIALIYVGLAPLFLLYVIAGLLYRAGSRNVALLETVIDGRHSMGSEIGRWRYAWIAISNFLATIFTLGLLRPWAAVRMARYMAAATALYSIGSLDDYLGELRDEGAAVGSEFMDVEGFDLGF
jgi:uncharacterized membrane protein YjgN (DUF898 family)